MSVENGVKEQVRVQAEEIRILRGKADAASRSLAAHDSEFRAVGNGQVRLEGAIRELEKKMESRFDAVAARQWRVGGIIIAAIGTAAAVAGLFT